MYGAYFFLLSLTAPFVFSLEDGTDDSELDLRIIGGSYAQQGQFPYHVSMMVDKKFRCGGALISKMYVLTAAHCLINRAGNFDAHDIKILIGHSSIKESLSAKIVIGAEKVFIPKTYSTTEKSHVIGDIAVLKLSGLLDIPDNWLLTLPPEDKLYTGQMGVATGHGFNWKVVYNPRDPNSGMDGSMDGKMRLLDVSIIDNQECARAYGRMDMPMSLVCVKPGMEGSLCDGDSGGPLVADGNVIVGVLSTGGRECQAEVPEVFTRVSSYIDFIYKSINESNDPDIFMIDMNYNTYQVY